MAQPLKIDRPERKNLTLPSSLVVQVELLLYSEVEGRVPKGAWQDYMANLIREDLRKRAEAARGAK